MGVMHARAASKASIMPWQLLLLPWTVSAALADGPLAMRAPSSADLTPDVTMQG